MILVLSCSCFCWIHWSRLLRRDRQCSNFIWVINKFIAYVGALYIRGLMVLICSNTFMILSVKFYDILFHSTNIHYFTHIVPLVSLLISLIRVRDKLFIVIIELHEKLCWSCAYYFCYSFKCLYYLHVPTQADHKVRFNWLMQERRNSSAQAMELRLSCINPSNSSVMKTWAQIWLELSHQSSLCPWPADDWFLIRASPSAGLNSNNKIWGFFF